jgi:hypothetical protein
VHADFIVDKCTATRKTQSFLDFDENSIISFLTEINWRLDADSSPFYAPNAVHAEVCVETSPATRKTQSFFAFDEHCYFFPD